VESVQYEQEIRNILGVDTPVVTYQGGEYYPISYISEKLLGRTGNILSGNKINQYYKDNIQKFSIDFNFINAGMQVTRTLSREALEKYIKEARTGRLSRENKNKLNDLAKYLKVNKQIVTNERFIDKYRFVDEDYGSQFIKDAVKEISVMIPNIKWQVCSKCGTYYPLHINFFKENQRSPHGLNSECRECNGWEENRTKKRIRMTDNYLSSIYLKYGDECYMMYRDKKVIEIYNHFLEKEISAFPKLIDTKEDILLIVKHLYETGIVTKDNITLEFLKDENKLYTIRNHIHLHDVYVLLFSNDYYLYPWKYKSFKYMKQTIQLNTEIAKQVFRNYLSEKQIQIDNIYDYDYESIVKECGIHTVYIENPLQFVVDLHDREYGGYQFFIQSTKYYQSKVNRIHDLKVLIEKDLNIKYDKVPLYLTMTNIINTSRTIYSVLKRYYSNIYEWVNEVYPDKYDIMDFNISVVRNEFDSAEENLIHIILKENFDNVIYNRRNSELEIVLGGYKPDWFILTEKGCWLVEYYGMYQVGSEKTNERVGKYIAKTKLKIEKYDEMPMYNKLYLYPEDLKDSCDGIRKKIKQIQ
jgi:hypothetical protein